MRETTLKLKSDARKCNKTRISYEASQPALSWTIDESVTLNPTVLTTPSLFSSQPGCLSALCLRISVKHLTELSLEPKKSSLSCLHVVASTPCSYKRRGFKETLGLCWRLYKAVNLHGPTEPSCGSDVAFSAENSEGLPPVGVLPGSDLQFLQAELLIALTDGFTSSFT